MPAPAKNRSLLAHLSLVAVTVVWGTTFPLVKAALRETSPLVFNALRMLLASAVLLAFNSQAVRDLTRRQLRFCATAGCFLALGYELQTVGLTRTTPSKSAFLTGLVVVFVPLISMIPGVRAADTPRPRVWVYLGAFVAFVGIVLLTSEPGTGFKLLAGMHLGEWLTLTAAIAFAFHLLTLARAASLVPARILGTMQIVCAAGVILPPLAFTRGFHLRWTPILCIALAVTSVLATAAGFTIQSWAQQHLAASHTALICALEPVFAALTSALLLGERLGPRALSGAILVLGGIVLAELGPTAVSEAGILPIEP